MEAPCQYICLVLFLQRCNFCKIRISSENTVDFPQESVPNPAQLPVINIDPDFLKKLVESSHSLPEFKVSYCILGTDDSLIY